MKRNNNKRPRQFQIGNGINHKNACWGVILWNDFILSNFRASTESITIEMQKAKRIRTSR